MKRSFVMICALFLIFTACGSDGSSDPCSFDIDAFSNGSSAATATTVWNCSSSGAGSFTFAFFDDGTGASSALGAFTWEEVGCQEADIAAYNGTHQIRNAEGSVASGIGTFTQKQPNGQTLTVSCTLGNL